MCDSKGDYKLDAGKQKLSLNKLSKEEIDSQKLEGIAGIAGIAGLEVSETSMEVSETSMEEWVMFSQLVQVKIM